jgi:hypothetical protein
MPRDTAEGRSNECPVYLTRDAQKGIVPANVEIGRAALLALSR